MEGKEAVDVNSPKEAPSPNQNEALISSDSKRSLTQNEESKFGTLANLKKRRKE